MRRIGLAVGLVLAPLAAEAQQTLLLRADQVIE